MGWRTIEVYGDVVDGAQVAEGCVQFVDASGWRAVCAVCDRIVANGLLAASNGVFRLEEHFNGSH